ncbi:polysaccharide deacetylase family protein [Paraglaciecola aquimarina]|uniref:Polysaccharide deacetylase family protein n=1 Tax=Paraglaciecola algarum TaxID=3050085 RepID=A0ABS9D4V6_9ALTE|nr:polysaccharide deacetylase family protein [Paraglaciecola sp. G1-23]MCF2947954.1 polysaccharide deacetylase family protein [Paraglaciecola sp. G1-23]
MNKCIQSKIPKLLVILLTFIISACSQTPAPKQIYLTYDDGPDPKFTPRLLDVLEKHGVKATIFVTGENAEKHPEIVKRAFDSGHTIGNHSYAHRRASEMTYDEIEHSYSRTDKIIRGITGQEDILFRAPYLNISAESKAYLCKVGNNSMYVDMAGIDWKTQDPDTIIDNILHKPRYTKTNETNPVVLLHDSGQNDFGTRQGTVDATDKFIPMMRAKGYVFADSPPRHKWQLSKEDCESL